MSVATAKLIELVDPEGNVFTGQRVEFNSPGKQGPRMTLDVTLT